MKDLEVYEYPIGFYSLEDTTARTLYRVIKDVLQRYNISLGSCRGENIRYDFLTLLNVDNFAVINVLIVL